LSFVRYLRAIADDQIAPNEAVRAYHADLQRLGITPRRPLADDLELTPNALSYSGEPVAKTKSTRNSQAGPTPDGDPDFRNMSAAEKVEWNLARWRRILGD